MNCGDGFMNRIEKKYWDAVGSPDPYGDAWEVGYKGIGNRDVLAIEGLRVTDRVT